MTVYVDTGNINSTLATITSLLNQILQQQTQGIKTMSDLKTQLSVAVAAIQAADTANQQADAAIQAAVNNAIMLIQSLHTSGGGGSVSDTDVQAAIDALQTAASDNSQATADYNMAATNLAAAQPQP